MQRGDQQWQATRQRARQLYEYPPRADHNWTHVEACLSELDTVRPLCANADAMEIALWFHDSIYDPRKHDNEERSAAIAREWLSAVPAPPSFCDTIAQLILLTRHNAIPTLADGKLMVDTDLSILGQPASIFDAYEQAIRQEYDFVPDEAFRPGRARILQSFLDRPSIYCTEPFQHRYEQQARTNLARSLRQLMGQ